LLPALLPREANVTLSEGTSIIGLIRSWLLDRPKVEIVLKLRDYGERDPTTFVERTGLYLDVEIHSTGPQPVHVLEVGLTLENEDRAVLGRIDKVLARPAFETIHRPLSDIKTEVGTRVVTGLYATATPERMFRRGLSKKWRQFPHELPPSEPGRDDGAMVAFR
jgi:hypothetical protein